MKGYPQTTVDLFWQHVDYRDFLRALTTQDKNASGVSRSQLAKWCAVTPAFITKVLAKKANLSGEHALALAQGLGFAENETLALIDKTLLAKVKSRSAKAILLKRVRGYFDRHYATVNPEGKRAEAPPVNLLFYRLAALLMQHKFQSAQELAKRMGTQVARIHFLIEKMSPYFSIEREGEKFRINPEAHQFTPRQPGSQSLYDLSMSLRRLATYSLESRYPIHIVDEREHYVSGSYILALSAEQIEQLSAVFAQLSKNITDTAQRIKASESSKLIAVCFDMFDAQL